jgi:solute carrier family 13 (sodium-dependent dicarboxylate transporter), member 2/3/5
LPLGLVLFALLALAPLPGIPPEARRMLAVTALMATWWVTEPIPLAATSLLPLVLLPLLGIAPAAKAAAPYANHLIYLFMGGFMLAQAMLRWGLHRRLALEIVAVVGVSPRRIVLGLMAASAFVSMWVSNTATAAMMMPLGLALVEQVSEAARERGTDIDLTPGRFHFGVDVMLGIAYAASIGGVGTLIGTPPNVLLAGTLEKSFGIQVTFLQWLALGVPFVVVFVPLAWLYLTRFAYPIEIDELPGGSGLIEEQLRKLGPMSPAEKRLSVLLALTAAAWIFRPLWTRLLPFGGLVTDSTIAVAAAVLAFLLPAGRGERLLDWPSASRLPWDVLILFGGGFALAEGFEISGLARWVGDQLALFSGVPLPLFLATIVVLTILLTEFASNTASAAMLIPVLGAIAVGMGDSPLLLCVPATVAASCAFMLPAATPPNAIVFGTGYFTIPQMVKAGVWVGLIAVVLTSLLALLLVRPVFGV